MDEFFSYASEPPPIVRDPKLRRAQSLVGTSENRPEHDFYPTPDYATQALLDHVSFTGSIWEPACGDGAICRVLQHNGYADLSATDLIDRGYGRGGIDFLTCSERAANVITNPPFTLGEDFVRHALDQTTGKVAMLCKLAFLEGAKRRVMFEATPLKTVFVFSKRLSMTRNGEKMKNSGMISFAWYLWEHGYDGPAQVAWL